jgi:ATP-dependent helicase/nuclease subunit A
MVAQRILELKATLQITDKETKELRPLRNSDIVILFRSLSGWGNEFATILEDCGIPAHVSTATGYFSAIEVQTVLSFLKILDNPYQDIPMAAVLKSAIVGLDNEELAEISLTEGATSFADAVLIRMEATTEGKLYAFAQLYHRLREKVVDTPIHQLIDMVLDETGYGDYVKALPAGGQRKANIDMLVEKAICYEKTSYKGLFHFIRYIDQLQKYEIDFGEADIIGENEDVVRLMTIHKSKGLEYTAVYFVGLEDSAFWNFRRQPDEDRCTFFVALSRAKESVTFTFCKRRTAIWNPMQQHKEINEFFDLLQRPGVAEVKTVSRTPDPLA